MFKLNTNLGDNSYTIYAGQNIINDMLAWLKEKYSDHRLYLISNATIKGFYLDLFKDEFAKIDQFLIPDAESAKSWDIADKIYEDLIKKKFHRKTLIIAFGGGVVGDLAGFIAATYMRSVPFVQVPTTLLSQVDSSVGGKVAINHSLGKNLIGSFYQPKAVFIDCVFLNTLSREELVCGFAEVVKYGYIADNAFLAELKESANRIYKKDLVYIESVIEKSVRIKKTIVEEDEKESGIRAILNFGHTFGHAIEAAYNYEGIKHGEAVFTGMKAALYYSNKAFSLENNLEEDISFINQQYQFKNTKNVTANSLLDLMAYDKKNDSDKIVLILLSKLGLAERYSTDNHALLKEAIEYMLDN
jgi:3-dehydroquinate synthase